MAKWKAAWGAAGLALSLCLAGCGGSNGEGKPSVTKSAPTDATRARVQSLFSGNLRANAMSGVQSVGYAASAPSAGSEGAGDSGNLPRGVPYLGAFFRQNAAPGTLTGAASRKRTRQENVSGNFYFDYYLDLWVEISETPTKTTYALYEDEAKQTPAGSIVTENPADYETFPQIYRSSYMFTAGYLKDAHGFYNSTMREDYSSTSDYENVYADGGKDKGTSSWSSNGDSTYKSRSDMADGSWTESVGTFREDGGGGTRYTSSDGYSATYTYNADGTGRGKISGNAPGLPATIVWDAYGNTTITYADGTVEHLDYGYGGGYSGGSDAVEPAEAVD